MLRDDRGWSANRSRRFHRAAGGQVLVVQARRGRGAGQRSAMGSSAKNGTYGTHEAHGTNDAENPVLRRRRQAWLDSIDNVMEDCYKTIAMRFSRSAQDWPCCIAGAVCADFSALFEPFAAQLVKQEGRNAVAVAPDMIPNRPAARGAQRFQRIFRFHTSNWLA